MLSFKPLSLCTSLSLRSKVPKLHHQHLPISGNYNQNICLVPLLVLFQVQIISYICVLVPRPCLCTFSFPVEFGTQWVCHKWGISLKENFLMTCANAIMCMINSMCLERASCFGMMNKGFMMEAEIESCPEKWIGFILIERRIKWHFKFCAQHEQKCRDRIRKNICFWGTYSICC